MRFIKFQITTNINDFFLNTINLMMTYLHGARVFNFLTKSIGYLACLNTIYKHIFTKKNTITLINIFKHDLTLKKIRFHVHYKTYTYSKQK